MHPHLKQIHIQHIDTQMLLFPPSTQHTPTTGGEGELISQHAYYILSSLTTSFSPLHTTYPHHRGEGGTYLSARLLNFVITYYILFPPPHNIPPPQGGEGELIFHTLYTPYTHALYTLSIHSIYILYTFYIHNT